MIKEILKKVIKTEFRIKIRRNIFELKGLLHKGNKFYCICCNQSFNKFLSFGNEKREDAQCPSCGSLERTRLLNYYLINETDIFFDNKSILHFAPESMLSKSLKKSSNKYLSVDIQKGYADKIEDIQNLTFEDCAYDYIICSCVLGHIPDEKKAIDELYRVLKIGAKAYILTVINLNVYETLEDSSAISDEQRLKLFGEKDLLRLHGTDFIERLKRSKVSVKQIDYSLNFSLHDRRRFSFGNKERELIFEIEKIKQD
ncbi:class I SAM-dependent methyltransferase [Pedobacter cryophilus]|uniref:Class I SAM-dependent methyltransferase n=1 Tax=Pedobacter cryophilus TaxID=2571271 RepID=A0A4U1BXM8_9SPHI|nr:class I SAM-dependent methyltransferase [Pedobacter cryophilus]TKB96066.1 class I SAM-dependent methyltransferase [Pedobacter cryophilus]